MSSGNYTDVFGRTDGDVCVQVPRAFRQCAKALKGHMNIIDTY